MKKKKKIRTTISFHFLLPLRIYWRRVSLFPFSREKTFERFSSSSSSTHRHSVNGGRHGEGETIVPPSSLERNYERDEVSIGILEYRRGGDPRGEIFAAPFILIRDTRRIEEGRETSTRITRPRFLRNLREILYPKTNVLPREEGKGRTCVTCGQGNPLFDSWLEHLSREIYVLRGATLADGYKLITLVLRPVVQPRSLFFLLFFFFFLSSPQTVSKMRALRGDDR